MRRRIRKCTPRHFTSDLVDKIKNYSTEPEFEFESKINTYLRPRGLKAKRVSDNPKSKQDIVVYEFDYKTLVEGRLVCKIDIEQKLKEDFHEYPNPPDNWFAWSFLCRKASERTNGDHDVYVLYNNETNPYNFDKIFWSSFLQIRLNCSPEGDGSRVDTYYRCPISKDFVMRGLDRLASYIVQLKDDGIFSKSRAKKTFLIEFGVTSA